MGKCVIFGASKTGNAAYRLLRNQYEVIGFADNDSKKWGQSFCGKEIFNPNQLSSMENVEIIIASVYYSSIYKQLKGLGVQNVQVFFLVGRAVENNSDEYKLYRFSDGFLFETCDFDKEEIKKIKNDFSQNYILTPTEEKIPVKKTDRKKVLFCAYIFPPLGGAGVQRSLKFVKYLRDFGYEPIILTVGENDKKLTCDTTLLEDIPKDITVIRIDSKVFLPELLPQEERQEIFNLYCGIVQSEGWIEEYLKAIQDADVRLIPDNQIIWVNECLKRIEQRLNLEEIDIIYTTGNPYSTYFLGYYIKRKYGIKWIQDYRDPWMTNAFYLENYHDNIKGTEQLQKELEKNLTRYSDAILVVAPKMKEEFVTEYGIHENKVFGITNGYDEDDFKNIADYCERNKKFTLCYNGMIYIDRNPLELLRIINELIDEKRIMRDEIQWIFNGTFEKDWKQKIDAMDQYQIVKYNGYLMHHDSIQSAIQSDLLILFGAKGEATKILYTGKVFEYIRMKRPILSFSTEGGVLTDILKETQTGENFEYDDSKNVKRYLLQKYDQWKNGEEEKCGKEEAIQKYSRKYLTYKLAEIFDNILEAD